MNAIVLSVNPHKGLSKKILPLEITSLYVGASRVHNHSELRVLPYTKKAKEGLKTLRRDPLLKLFFGNFDSERRWKDDGLKHIQEDYLRKVKIDLGLVTNIQDLTKEEALYFLKNLDEMHDRKSSHDVLVHKLKAAHQSGQAILAAENSKLLRFERLELVRKLLSEGLNDIGLKRLRYYAKRLAIPDCRRSSRKLLRRSLYDIAQHFFGNDSLGVSRIKSS